MAAIIRDDKQDNALVEIEAALATVKQLNLMLGDRNMAAVFQIAMVPEKGRGVKVDVVHPEKKIFFSLCAKYRARLVKEIRVKAEKFRISLDSKDLACMEEGENPESLPDTEEDADDGDTNAETGNDQSEDAQPDPPDGEDA